MKRVRFALALAPLCLLLAAACAPRGVDVAVEPLGAVASETPDRFARVARVRGDRPFAAFDVRDGRIAAVEPADDGAARGGLFTFALAPDGAVTPLARLALDDPRDVAFAADGIVVTDASGEATTVGTAADGALAPLGTRAAHDSPDERFPMFEGFARPLALVTVDRAGAGRFAFALACAAGGGGLELVVVRNDLPGGPAVVGRQPVDDLAALDVDGDVLTAAGASGVRWFDVADPANPRQDARLALPGARLARRRGDLLIVLRTDLEVFRRRAAGH